MKNKINVDLDKLQNKNDLTQGELNEFTKFINTLIHDMSNKLNTIKEPLFVPLPNY